MEFNFNNIKFLIDINRKTYSHSIFLFNYNFFNLFSSDVKRTEETKLKFKIYYPNNLKEN